MDTDRNAGLRLCCDTMQNSERHMAWCVVNKGPAGVVDQIRAVGGVPCAVPGCKRGAYHDHPEFGTLTPPEMPDGVKQLIAARDKEIAELKARRTECGHYPDVVHASKALLDLLASERDAASDLVRRARPILADSRHHPEVEKLLREIRDFLEPAAPAAKKPSAADVILASVFSAKALAAGKDVVIAARPRHSEMFVGLLSQRAPVGEVSCVRCEGRWRRREDVPEFCEPEEPGQRIHIR